MSRQLASMFTGRETYQDIQDKLSDFRAIKYNGLSNWWVDIYGNTFHYPDGGSLRYNYSKGVYFIPTEEGGTRSVRIENAVASAWWHERDDAIAKQSPYYEKILNAREFNAIQDKDKRLIPISNTRVSQYWITRFGEVWAGDNFHKYEGQVDGGGYRYLSIGSMCGVRVHRLVAEAFIPIPTRYLKYGFTKDTLQINHIDGNKLNNRWDNLEWVTRKENMEHASITGLLQVGISDEMLELVWKLLSEGKRDIDIARITRIPTPTVSNIRQGVSPRYRTDKYTWPKRSPGGQTDLEQHQKIIDLWNQGLKYKEIAEITGSCESHIGEVLDAHPELVTRERRDNSAQTNGSKVDDETLTKIFEMLQDNKTNEEIRDVTNVRIEKIASIRARRVYKKQGALYIWPEKSPGGREVRRYTPEEREALDLRICNLRKDGVPYSEIAKMLKVDEKRISDAVKRHPEYATGRWPVKNN